MSGTNSRKNGIRPGVVRHFLHAVHNKDTHLKGKD